MTEQTVSKTDEAVASVLEAALEAAKVTGNFVVEQAPDLVQQLLLFNTVKFGLVFSVTACGAVITGITAGKLFKKAQQRSEQSSNCYATMDDFAQFWGGVFSAGAGIILSIIAVSNSVSFLKITLAPKVWLLEYAAALIK